jgi:hypothetical protein
VIDACDPSHMLDVIGDLFESHRARMRLIPGRERRRGAIRLTDI